MTQEARDTGENVGRKVGVGDVGGVGGGGEPNQILHPRG